MSTFRGYRVAWCVKCNGELPSRKGRCISCGEKVTPKSLGSGGFKATPTVGPYSGKQRDSKQEAEREPVLQALANADRKSVV